MAKKNFWLEILTIMLVLGIMVIGCDNDNSHTHSYNKNWSSNMTQHWHECSCGDKTDVANHTIISNICSVCNYDDSGNNKDISAYAGTYISNSNASETMELFTDGNFILKFNYYWMRAIITSIIGNTGTSMIIDYTLDNGTTWIAWSAEDPFWAGNPQINTGTINGSGGPGTEFIALGDIFVKQ